MKAKEFISFWTLRSLAGTLLITVLPYVDLLNADDHTSKSASIRRTWRDNTGNFTVVARLLSQSKTDITLETYSGRIITVPKAKLSANDHKWLKEKAKEANEVAKQKAAILPEFNNTIDFVFPQLPTNKTTTTNTSRTGKNSTESLLALLKTSLATSNRDIARVQIISNSDTDIKIRIAVNDNLFTPLIKSGAKRDVRDCLKAIDQASISFEKLHFDLTFEFIDKFGNSQEGTVVELTYNKSTVNQINWSNFLFGDVFDIADGDWIHPSF